MATRDLRLPFGVGVAAVLGAAFVAAPYAAVLLMSGQSPLLALVVGVPFGLLVALVWWVLPHAVRLRADFIERKGIYRRLRR